MKPTITLTKALADPALLGGPFQAPSFWTWKVLGKVIDGIELTERREIELFEQCTGRPYNRQARRAFRRIFILVGRRGGKDRFMSAVAMWRTALVCDWRRYASAGEQICCLQIGADKRQANILSRYAAGLLASPMLQAEVSRQTGDVIEFKNGGALEIVTNNAASPRGRSAAGVFGTETCHWQTDEANASSDEEVVAAVEPSMAACPDGGLLILASSVFRKRGFKYRMYKKLHGADAEEDLCWFATSRTMNPRLPQAFIDRAIANDGPRARAEFLNIWREDSDDYIPADVVEGCTDWGVHERPRQPGLTYVAFADAAGGTGQDSFTLAIGHAEADAARSVVIDLVREKRPRFVASDTIAEYARVLHAYGVSEIVADGFAGGFCSDEWQRAGVRFRAAEFNTSENYLRALPLLTSQRARLVDDAVLRGQLTSLERRVVSGHETVGHAQRSSAHDDLACAVCGCLSELGANTPVDWATVGPQIHQLFASRQFGGAGQPQPGSFQMMMGERARAQMLARRSGRRF